MLPKFRSYAPANVTSELPIELDFPAFAFVMTLAAVINGMGIVRLLASFAEYPIGAVAEAVKSGA